MRTINSIEANIVERRPASMSFSPRTPLSLLDSLGDSDEIGVLIIDTAISSLFEIRPESTMTYPDS